MKKELYWSEPGSVRRTELNQAAAVGNQAAAIVQECWVTDIHVQCHDNVVVKAKTAITSASVHTHLYMAVIAPRCEGVFAGAVAERDESVLQTTERMSLGTGNIYAPRFIVTQPLTAPVLSPDFRNDCIEPLDQMTHPSCAIST